MDTEQPTQKTKRQLSPEHLEKLKMAREKALQKKQELRQLRDAEKEMKEQKLNERRQRVEAFKKQKEAPPQTEMVEANTPSDSEESLIEELIVKKKPKKKGRVVRKIVEVSSSSSDSSSDEEDYRLKLKQKYKNKYKNKYTGGSLQPPRDVVKEHASDVIRNNVSKELRRIAMNSVFPEY